MLNDEWYRIYVASSLLVVSSGFSPSNRR